MVKMNAKMIIMIIVSMILYIGVNYYIGLNIYKGLTSVIIVSKYIFWSLFLFLSMSFFISLMIKNIGRGSFYNITSYLGNYYIGILGYLIIIIPISQLVLVLIKKYLNYEVDLLPYLTILVLVFMAIILVKGTWNGNNYIVNNFDIQIDKDLENEVNAVLVSDIHIGDIIDNKRISKMVEGINELKPDIVLIAGDLIDSDLTNYLDSRMYETLGQINSKYGVYFSLGNHDLYTGKTDELINTLKEVGITTLRDEAVLINNEFYIVGRDDISISKFQKERKILNEILVDEDKEKPVIVIDHTPKNLNEAMEAGVDLQVSGHTHRGQFAPYNLFTQKMFEIDYGYKKKENLNVIISSGFGTWGPPIRIGSRSEIINIKITGK